MVRNYHLIFIVGQEIFNITIMLQKTSSPACIAQRHGV